MPINDQISGGTHGQHLTAYGTGFSTDLVRIVIYLSAMWRLALISLLVIVIIVLSLSLIGGGGGESPMRGISEENQVKWIRLRVRIRLRIGIQIQIRTHKIETASMSTRLPYAIFIVLGWTSKQCLSFPLSKRTPNQAIPHLSSTVCQSFSLSVSQSFNLSPARSKSWQTIQGPNYCCEIWCGL